jgi:hypothetical protein
MSDIDYAEERVKMVDRVQDAIRDHRQSAKDLHRLLHSSRRYSDPGNVMPFLSGVQVGLELAEQELEDGISPSILRGPEDGDSE